MIAARRLALLAVATALLAATAARAEGCKPAKLGARGGSARPCTAPSKIEPYDPDRVRSGSRPGFIDLGNGTEVRIGGRARLDYDMRR